MKDWMPRERRKNISGKPANRKTMDNLKLTDWNTIRDCDVIITSSSRPELLKLTMHYLETYLCFHGNFRFILHEDFVIPKESEKLVKWAENSGYFKKEDIICNNPPVGLEQALVNLMKRAKSPFVLYMQDDWVFERPIELDKAMYIMEHVSKVNNILFYKLSIPHARKTVFFREYYFPQFPQYLTLNNTWELMPGLWRTNFIKPVIIDAMRANNQRTCMKKTAPAKITFNLRNADKKDDMDFLYQNMGVFFWGQWGEPRYCRHIGENARMENWRMNNGKPGTENNPQENPAISNMARWIPFEHIPKIKGRNSIKIMQDIIERKNKKKGK